MRWPTLGWNYTTTCSRCGSEYPNKVQSATVEWCHGEQCVGRVDSQRVLLSLGVPPLHVEEVKPREKPSPGIARIVTERKALIYRHTEEKGTIPIVGALMTALLMNQARKMTGLWVQGSDLVDRVMQGKAGHLEAPYLLIIDEPWLKPLGTRQNFAQFVHRRVLAKRPTVMLTRVEPGEFAGLLEVVPENRIEVSL